MMGVEDGHENTRSMNGEDGRRNREGGVAGDGDGYNIYLNLPITKTTK